MDLEKITRELLDKKANEDNRIDLNAYAMGLSDLKKQLLQANVVGRSEQFKCHSCGTKHSGKNDDQLYEVCKDCFDSI